MTETLLDVCLLVFVILTSLGLFFVIDGARIMLLSRWRSPKGRRKRRG